MNNKDTEKVLEELQQVRPEKLNKKAKRLFEAIMEIADERDEANNIISDLLDVLRDKESLIDEMAGYLAIIRTCPNEDCGANLDCENRCKDDDKLYEECWKMYFERKIENEH